MRNKLLLAFLLLFCGTVAMAQDVKVYTKPRAFLDNERVELIVDVTGTPLAGSAGPLYVWTWQPADPGNGAWTNSAEKMKMERVNGNVWKFVMVPKDLYGKAVGPGTKIEFLVKEKDGSKQTANIEYEVPKFANPGGQIAWTAPAAFTDADQTLSILFDAKQAWGDGGKAQGELVGESEIFIWSGANDFSKGAKNGEGDWGASANSAKLTPMGNDIWRFDFIPSEYYDLAPAAFKNIAFLMKNKTGSKSGRDVGGKDLRVTLVSKTLPPAIVSTFPVSTPDKEKGTLDLKATGDDIITIIFDRKNETNPDMKKQRNIYAYTALNNNWTLEVAGWGDVPKTPKLKLKANADSTHTLIMIPRLFYGAPATLGIERLNFVFRDSTGDIKSGGGDGGNYYVKLVLPTGNGDDLKEGSYGIAQSYPNPVSIGEMAAISYSLPKAQDVTLTIYNIYGQAVQTLVSGHQDAGRHHVMWNVDAKYAAGQYFYTIKAGDFTATRKIIVTNK